MAEAVRDFTVGVRLCPAERATLEALVEEIGASSPADALRRLLQAAQETTAGRLALPLVAAHLRDAEAERAQREAIIARGAETVRPGTLWRDDPGVVLHLDTIPVALPNGDPRAIRGALAHGFTVERNRWARLGLTSKVRTLAANARGLRANSLKTALAEDDPAGVALGWADPDVAARVLGRRFHSVPRRGRHGVSLPVAVVIGVGSTSLEAHQSARGHGWGPDVRGAAETVEVNATLMEVAKRLMLDGTPLDLHELVARVRAESE